MAAKETEKAKRTIENLYLALRTIGNHLGVVCCGVDTGHTTKAIIEKIDELRAEKFE